MLVPVVVFFLAAGLCVTLTRSALPLLARRKLGQPIHEDRRLHAGKAGTPTMGGVVIVTSVGVAFLTGTVLFGIERSGSALLVLGLTVACGAVGLADDLTKVRSGCNQGIRARSKALALLVAGGGFAIAVVALHPSGHPPIVRLGSIVVLGSPAVTAVWILVLVLASANAVNLTDGLDGLAAGAAVVSFGAMAVVAAIIGPFPGYGLSVETPLATLAAAFAGASLGFLRWNAHPARIFMGDTGALALGGGLAGLAAVTSTGVLLPLVGLLFVIEASSVIVLVVAFRAFGRRPFHAPIHHQFERPGLREAVLVRRLWAVSLGGAGAALLLAGQTVWFSG